MSRLTLYLLGLPRVEMGDREVHITRRKAMALLAYVALTKLTHSREELATFFWPDYTQSQSLAYLRRVLSDLNTSLDGAGLIIDRTTVRMDAASIWVDVDAFHQQLAVCKSHNHPMKEVCRDCVSQLEKAVSLYKDNFMKGFSLRDSVAFDEWQLFQAEELQRVFAFTLERLVHWYHSQKTYESAVAYANRWLAMDPLQEPAHRALIQIFSDMGQRTAALQQYQLCANTLREELGTIPSNETATLYEQIRDSAGERVDQHILPSTFTPPLSQDQTPLHNLPAQLTSFIGREKEISQIQEKMLHPDIRLLTLTGPGGSGKTRLSLAVAEQVLSEFPDGVFFVSLASLRDPALVLDAIAQTFGLRNAGDMPLSEIITRFLTDKRILLVLDNFEHLIQAAPCITSLLKALPHLSMLVTSRSLLHVTGEHQFPVLPLDLPDSKTTNLQPLAQNEAVQLFVDRAKAVKPGFTLTDQNTQVVSDICTRLDGLPLAIELAAARVRLLSLPNLQSQLQNRLRFLTGGALDLPAHQRTLRSTIEWSYALLSEDEQVLYRRLAVFAGGCTLQAAETVCNSSSGRSLQVGLCLDVLNCLEKLMDQSLLQQSVVQGTARFTILETIREYALEKLAESGEIAWLRQAHAYFFLELAEKAESNLFGPEPGSWMDKLNRELDNLRVALAWAMENDSACGLRLTAALTWFWISDARLTEGRDWLTQAIEQPQAKDAPHRTQYACALKSACVIAWFQGDSFKGLQMGEQSVAIFRSLGDTRKLADALYATALATFSSPDSVRTLPLLDESITLYKQINDPSELAKSLLLYGAKLYQRGEHKLALSQIEESHDLAVKHGRLPLVAEIENYYGQIAFSDNDFAAAWSHFEKQVQLEQKMGRKIWIPGIFWALGDILFHQGEYEQARTYYQKSLAMFLKMGNTANAAESIERLGKLALRQGQIPKAKALYFESLVLLQNVERRAWKVAKCLFGLAQIADIEDQPERFVTLVGAVETHRSKIPSIYHWVELEPVTDKLQTYLDKPYLKQAYNRGLSMSKEQAIDYALSDENIQQRE